MKQTGLEVRPMFHWTARRIEAHVKPCVSAPQMQRAAEIRRRLSWARIADAIGGLKAVRYRCESRTCSANENLCGAGHGAEKLRHISAGRRLLDGPKGRAEAGGDHAAAWPNMWKTASSAARRVPKVSKGS
jgi:hypothetical protein